MPTPTEPTPPPRRRRHTIGVPRLKRPLLFRTVLVLVLLGLAGVAAGSWWVRNRAPRRVDAAVRRWMTARVLALSDSVYRLDIGRITYDPHTASVALDSFRVLTDSARNAGRDHPLPGVTVVVRGGHVDGVRVRNLLFGGRRTVAVGVIRFDDVDADVVLPPRLTGSAPPAAADTGRAPIERDFFEWERGVSLPEGVPRIRVAQVQVPQVTVIVRPPSGTPGQVRVLPQLALELDSLLMDARDTATTPVYATDIRLSADHYAGGWDSLTTLSIDHAEGSFADSVLRVQGVEIRPTHTDAELRRMPGVRGPRVVAGLGSFDARGIAWGDIFRHATIAVRAVEIDRPRLDLLADHSRPEPRGTGDRPASLPHQIMRDAALRILIDSVRVRDGQIVYGELEPGKPKPGIVTFDDFACDLVNLSNDPGRMSDARPLVVTASARLMGSGRLAAQLEIPLLSSGFDLRYHGTLGPMPFADFNRFAGPNTGIRFDKGEVVGVEFSATVKDGRARGRVVPRYRDLGIGFTEKGGGLFARAKRSITRFIANRFVIRRDNPGDGGKGRLVSAPIDLEHRPSDGLFTFLWYSLRDPIGKVVKP